MKMNKQSVVDAISLLALVIVVVSLGSTPCIGLASQADASTPAWLVMLYLDADDVTLEQSIWQDLNEAELIGSSQHVTIVAQLDRYAGGFDGDGDWSTTRRYLVTKDEDLYAIGSLMLDDLGEENMGDGKTLVDFVTWAIATYPADRYVLILSDHGVGWPGGWTDDDPPPFNMLSLNELDTSLEVIRTETGIGLFDIIGLDACLMSGIEVASALEPHARYMVSSQENIPGIGLAYAAFLEDLSRNPHMSTAELAQSIVSSYVDRDIIITDDVARALHYLERFYDLSEEERNVIAGMNPDERYLWMVEKNIPSGTIYADDKGADATLSAIDLLQFGEVTASLDGLIATISNLNQAIVAMVRKYSQSFGIPAYIDLGHFASLISRESQDLGVEAAATALNAAIDRAVIAERHGALRPGSTGISIYFPNTSRFTSEAWGYESYTSIASRFAEGSAWDDFLAFHFTGSPIEAGAIVDVDKIVPPGQGEISILPISTTDAVLAPGEITILETEIVGKNIGYVYLFVGLYYEENDSILIVDKDFIDGGSETLVLNGVYYPDWPEDEPIEISVVWEAILWNINDETHRDFAVIPPESYGPPHEYATFGVDGIYTFTDGGESREAVAIFQNGELKRVFGFSDEGDLKAPREIQIRPGDTFTVLHRWLDYVDEEQGWAEYSTTEGSTFTFGEDPLYWDTFPAFPGDYVIGIEVEDLEGTMYAEYIWFTVSEDEDVLWTEGTLFRDNFISGRSAWDVSEWETGATYYYDEEALYGMWIAEAQSSTYAWAPYAGEFPADFVAEVDAALAYGPEDGFYGIIWGLDSDNFYAFRVSADGLYRLDLLVDNEWQPALIDWTECPELMLGYAANQLRVCVEGEEISLIVNEDVVATIAGPSFGSGWIGLIASTLEYPDVEVWFDNFQVWEL